MKHEIISTELAELNTEIATVKLLPENNEEANSIGNVDEFTTY